MENAIEYTKNTLETTFIFTVLIYNLQLQFTVLIYNLQQDFAHGSQKWGGIFILLHFFTSIH